MSAEITAKQENGSRVYLEMYIESSRKPTETEFFESLVKVYPELAKDAKLAKEWLNTYSKQAEALKRYLSNSKGYNYSRDDRQGFMFFIEDVAKKRCGVTNKDRWNPADIYLVKKNKEYTIRKTIDSITKNTEAIANIYALNDYMSQLIKSKDLVPISLKAISKTKLRADFELANVEKKSANSVLPNFKFDGELKCYLRFGTNSSTKTEIDNGEISGKFYADSSLVNWQTRNFNMSSPRGGVQTDLTPTGRNAGAKLGKTSSEAIDDFFTKNKSKLGVSRPVSPSKDPNIPAVGSWTEKDIKYWVDYQNSLKKYKVNGKPIDFGGMKIMVDGKLLMQGKFKDVLEYSIKYENSTRYAAGRLSSKLICLRWAEIWGIIEQKGLMEEWLKTLYYGAKKEFKDTNGPFLKIY